MNFPGCPAGASSSERSLGRCVAPFDKIHALPGPSRKVIFLRKTQEQNTKHIGYVHILPVRNNSIVKFVAESPTTDFDEFARLVTEYFQDLNLLAEISTKPVEAQLAQPATIDQEAKGIQTAQPIKTTGEYSIGFFLEFEKGKTPRNLFVLIACTAYLKDPNDIGSIGLMRRVYASFRSIWDQLNAIKQINPDTPGLATTMRILNERFPNLTAENMTEGEILKETALKILTDFKDALMTIDQNKYFFNNSELIPASTRAIIEQIRALSIDEASELFAVMPLVEKWKKDINPSQPGQAKTALADLTAKPEKPQTLPPIYADNLQDVKKLSLEGLTVKVIALRLRISESSVKRYRKELGLQRRRQ